MGVADLRARCRAMGVEVGALSLVGREVDFVVEAAEAICSATCRETLEAVGQAGNLVRGNAGTSKAVVKMWLSENPEVGLET